MYFVPRGWKSNLFYDTGDKRKPPPYPENLPQRLGSRRLAAYCPGRSGNKLPPFFFLRQSLQTQELPWSLVEAGGFGRVVVDGGVTGLLVKGELFVGVLAFLSSSFLTWAAYRGLTALTKLVESTGTDWVKVLLVCLSPTSNCSPLMRRA